MFSAKKSDYVFTAFLFLIFSFLFVGTSQFLNASLQSIPNHSINNENLFDSNILLISDSSDKYSNDLLTKDAVDSYSNVVETINSTVLKCQGLALCLKGDVVKVINGKSFYVSINNKIYKIDLALIGIPATNTQSMMASAAFIRNACLGETVLIDQDDGQRNSESIIGTVYCSHTKSLNAMLLDTGYVQLDRAQCLASEFSKVNWANSRGC